MGTETEACDNCGRTIGKLETPQVWENHVVCSECRARLAAKASGPHVRPRPFRFWLLMLYALVLVAAAVLTSSVLNTRQAPLPESQSPLSPAEIHAFNMASIKKAEEQIRATTQNLPVLLETSLDEIWSSLPPELKDKPPTGNMRGILSNRRAEEISVKMNDALKSKHVHTLWLTFVKIEATGKGPRINLVRSVGQSGFRKLYLDVVLRENQIAKASFLKAGQDISVEGRVWDVTVFANPVADYDLDCTLSLDDAELR